MSLTSFTDKNIVFLSLAILLGLGCLIAAAIIDLVDGSDAWSLYLLYIGILIIIVCFFWNIFHYMNAQRLENKTYDKIVARYHSDDAFRSHVDETFEEKPSKKSPTTTLSEVTSIPLGVMNSVPASNSPIILPGLSE